MVADLTYRADWLEQIHATAVACEARRPSARYNTGTISEAACFYLRALTEHFAPRVAVEVGTFIGTSTSAIKAGHIYTCDKSNDCVPSSKRITCHPFTSSTRMLSQLKRRGVVADFFFFDGRIKAADVGLILDLSTSLTVYAFDDYEGDEKGVINVQLLLPHLSKPYTLMLPPGAVPPAVGLTTIAVLAPP